MQNAPNKVLLPPENIANIPNTLTAIRACVVGYVSYLLATEWPGIETGILYAWAMATDFLDGYLARKLHQETRFGKRLDPIVDSVSFHLPLWALAYESTDPMFQSVCLVSSGILAVRDIHLFRKCVELEDTGEMLQVSQLGKVKTAVQMAALSILIATPHTHEFVQEIGIWGLIAGTSLSLVSWLDYCKKFREKLSLL